MGKYQELQEQHQKEFNAFPLHFAFGEKQMDEKRQTLGLSKNPKILATQIVCIGGGGFILKKDYPAFVEMCCRHKKERVMAMADDPQYLYEMFYTELSNHEYSYTEDATDALLSLGLSFEDIKANPVMEQAFCKAAQNILRAAS